MEDLESGETGFGCFGVCIQNRCAANWGKTSFLCFYSARSLFILRASRFCGCGKDYRLPKICHFGNCNPKASIRALQDHPSLLLLLLLYSFCRCRRWPCPLSNLLLFSKLSSSTICRRRQICRRHPCPLPCRRRSSGVIVVVLLNSHFCSQVWPSDLWESAIRRSLLLVWPI